MIVFGNGIIQRVEAEKTADSAKKKAKSSKSSTAKKK